MPTSLLHIAAIVEAAVEAYMSVREYSDSEEWTTMFERELVSAHLCGVSITHAFDVEAHHSGVPARFRK